MHKTLILLFDAIVDSQLTKIIKEEKINSYCNLSRVALDGKFNLNELNKDQFIHLNSYAREKFLDIITLEAAKKNEQGLTIRDVFFDDLPMYWFADYSVKHPYNHPLLALFVLKEYIKEGIFDEKELVVYCPDRYSKIIPILSEMFPQCILKVFLRKQSLLQGLARFFKHNANVLRKIYSLPVSKDDNAVLMERTIFFTKLNQVNYLNKVISKLEEVDVLNNDYLKIDYNSWENNGEIDRNFLARKPKLWDLLLIFFKLFKTKLYLVKRRLKGVDSSSFQALMYDELDYLITTNPHSFYSYSWLKSFFRSLKEQTKILYEDEFYTYGRIISAAAKHSKNSNVTTYGVQHGMFSDNHTVYHITDVELDSTNSQKFNGLPIPNHFITWGRYFSSFFLKNNNLEVDYLREFGNPLFTFDSSKRKRKQLDLPKFKIVYCLTSEMLFHKELPILNEILRQNENCELYLRHHPRFEFKINLSDIKYATNIKFSTSSTIYEAIERADVVLTSAHSTIFIDSIVCKVPVIRIKTSIVDSTMENNYEDCIVVDKKYKASLDFQILFEGNNKVQHEDYLYMKNDHWLNFFKESSGNK